MPSRTHLGKGRCCRQIHRERNRQNCCHRKPEYRGTARHLWRDLEGSVGDLADHFGLVKRSDVSRWKLEGTRLIEANGVLDFERALGDVVVVGAESVESALGVNRPNEALGVDLLAGGGD